MLCVYKMYETPTNEVDKIVFRAKKINNKLKSRKVPPSLCII